MQRKRPNSKTRKAMRQARQVKQPRFKNARQLFKSLDK